MRENLQAAFDALERAVAAAEEKLSQHHCPFSVEFQVSDDLVLGWQKKKGRFHICILFEPDEWHPLADCSVADRLSALPHISKLNNAVCLRADYAAREILETLASFQAEFFAPEEPAA